MAINENAAHIQAAKIVGYSNDLRNTVNLLSNYKSSIMSNWQGAEVHYITCSIDQVISQINSVIRQLESIGPDINSTAAAIRREEEAAAAAARARAARQQRIQTAQTNYNRAIEECDSLYKERQELEKLLKGRVPANRVFELSKKMAELTKKIEEAERKRNDCYNALVVARR